MPTSTKPHVIIISAKKTVVFPRLFVGWFISECCLLTTTTTTNAIDDAAAAALL